MIRIGINGLGRIGRLALRAIRERYPDRLQVVGFNDINPAPWLAPIIQRDSVYGPFPGVIAAAQGAGRQGIEIDGLFIPLNHAGQYGAMITHAKLSNPFWRDVGADVVLECSGGGPDGDRAQEHIWAGAKKVIISAPAPNVDAILVLGVNMGLYNPAKHHVISMASCTTNCVGPVLKIVDDIFGIESAYLTSVTSYTNSQRLVDAPHADPRRARAAGNNIIPTESSTGDSIGQIIPRLKGRYQAMAFRVPVMVGAVSHMRLRLGRSTKAKELIGELALSARHNHVFSVSDQPLVSSDIIGNSHSAIVDSLLTQVDEQNVTVVAWYDNEWAYACRLADMAAYIGERLGT